MARLAGVDSSVIVVPEPPPAPKKALKLSPIVSLFLVEELIPSIVLLKAIDPVLVFMIRRSNAMYVSIFSLSFANVKIATLPA